MNWIGIKYLVLHCLEEVIRFFYFHKHDYVIYLQPEISIGSYTQPATLDDPRGCNCKCSKCGKYVHFRIIKPGTMIMGAPMDPVERKLPESGNFHSHIV